MATPTSHDDREVTQPAVTDASALTARHAVSGPARSGVTSLVVERAVMLADAGDPVLVVHPLAAGARHLGASLLARTPAVAGSVAATSSTGLARELLTRHGDRRRLLAPAERTRFIASLLAHEAEHAPQHWPVSGALLGRPAFAATIARAVDAARAMWVGPDEIDAHERAVGADGRWSEAVAFGVRMAQEMRERGVVDRTGLFVDAVALLRAPGALERWRNGVPHLLVDDAQALDPAAHRLLLTLASPAVQPDGATLLIAGHPHAPRWASAAAVTSSAADVDDPIAALARRLGVVEHTTLPTRPHPTPAKVLVRPGDPALEADAAVGALLDALDHGARPEQVVIVVPDGAAGRALGAAITRVATRCGIDVHGAAPLAGVQPGVVALHALVEALALGAGNPTSSGTDAEAIARAIAPAVRTGLVDGPDDPRLVPLHALGSMPAQAFAAWSSLLAPVLVGASAAGRTSPGDDRALDAIVTYLGAIDEGIAAADALEAPVRTGTGGALVTNAVGTVGGSWHTVIVCGAIEGTLPHTTVRVPRLDPALLEGPDVPDLVTRHRRVLAEETRRFAHLAARAETQLVAIAAPRPGVLVSRFVEGWAVQPPRLEPGDPGAPPTPLTESPGEVPVWPEGTLRLSATQLTAFENCPLDYAYQYAVGVRSVGGVSARVGSLVHEVLERLLHPDAETPTRERMFRLLAELWDPAMFDYRPQEAQYQRDVESWLDAWWTLEGERLRDVVAVEHEFDLPIGPHTLKGSIDRVNLLADGDFEVVDYKTGGTRKQAEVDDDLQLRVYHLAARRDPVLRERGEPSRLRLLFLAADGGPKSMDLTVTDDLEAQTEQRILGLADQILSERYEPSVDASCDYCSFARLCPLQIEGRETP